jgi:hypothetical protein
MISSFRNRRIMAALSTNVSSVAPWWLSGGIPAANCIAAYQPKGAASLAASYVNLAAPGNGLADGTYDAVPIVAPTWNSTNGWIGDGTKILYSPIIFGSTWSVIARFENFGFINPSSPFGYVDAGGSIYVRSYTGVETRLDVRHMGSRYLGSSRIATGTLALADNHFYKNGSYVADCTHSETLPLNAQFGLLGIRNFLGGDVCMDANLLAVSIYNITITTPQVLALNTAMAAL